VRAVGIGVLAFILCLLGVSRGSEAQEGDVSSETAPAAAQGAGAATTSHGFGGPSSVGGALRRDEKSKARTLTSYFDFKDRLKKEHGFGFGVDYFALYQRASSSPGEDEAGGGAFRVFGQWDLVKRGSANTGSLVYKVENRHRLATPIAPQDLGFEVGYVGLTAITFSDIGWALTNLYWEQQLAGGRLAVVAGVLDTTDYVDIYALADPWNDFMNLAFSTNPTIPVPNQGLGAAVRFMATDHVYVLAGLEDANGDPTDPGGAWGSFFDTGEYFSHVELGWVSSLKNGFTDNAHLVAWHADAREDAQVPSGWGLAASWSQKLAARWQPFVRAGYSEGGGALWERSLSVGTGYSFRDGADVLAVGLNWGRPSEESYGPDVKDQVTAQVFYNWHPLRFLTVIPDLQLLFDPALNPDEDLIAVYSVRARLAF